MSEEPCGNIPQRGGTLHIHFCEYHQAWYVHSHAHRVDADADDRWTFGPRSDWLGPFDGAGDVLQLVCSRVADVLHAMGLNWADTEPSNT